jgi:hypothetical protein
MTTSRQQPVGRSTSPRAGYEVLRGSGPSEPEALHKNFHVPLWEVTEKVLGLLRWQEGWNGFDVAAPNHKAVTRAIPWIRDMYRDALKTGREWQDPHVTADEDGDVMFEWWNGERGLTIYISEESSSYIIDWGTNITSEMDDGEASTSEKRRELWSWLTD